MTAPQKRPERASAGLPPESARRSANPGVDPNDPEHQARRIRIVPIHAHDSYLDGFQNQVCNPDGDAAVGWVYPLQD